MAGHIWPAGRYLPTPVLVDASLCRVGLPRCLLCDNRFSSAFVLSGRLQVSFEEVSSIISTYERLSNEVDKRRQLSEMQADLGNLKLSKM